MADDFSGAQPDLGGTAMQIGELEARMRDLDRTAALFARTMTAAFTASALGARSFDDVLKSLVLRFSDLAVKLAFKPVENALFGAFSGLLRGGAAGGEGVKAFATGGIIGTPSYFPLPSGGLGLAGEAGPEAIVPLSRGSDGRLGVAMPGGGAAPSIVVHIATPDAASFRRSEAYVTGQIARAVARGQRGL